MGGEKTFREMMNVEFYRLLIEIDVALNIMQDMSM
jgi:hypothetical protein